MKLLKLPLFVLFLFFAQHGLAQGKLSGTVQDAKGQPLGFVNVAVLKATDGKIVTGTIASLEGGFQMVAPGAGMYKVRLSMIGYTTLETALFEVNGNNFNKDFGNLTLLEDTGMLGEVVVQAMRPTVINQADKMVVSVEGTALASGATAFEVLTKSPGVWVDQEGNIKLNGKAGVQIMVDGRTSYLSGKELQNLLQSMSAENIKDLEIITNPSARYDAEGASGIININLKKNTIAGMNGSVYAGYQYAELHGYSAGTDLNYKQGRWSSFANLDVAERTRFRSNNMQRTSSDNIGQSLNQRLKEKGSRFVPALRIGTDYSINTQHSIGVSGSVSRYRTQDQVQANTYLSHLNQQTDVYVNAANKSNNKYNNSALNLHYLGNLDTLGTTLSANVDYVRLISDDKASFLNKYDSLGTEAPVRTDLLLSENPGTYDIYAAKTDFTKSLGKLGKLEAGAKVSHVVSDNELHFYTTAGNIQHLDESRSNHFIYKENIYAAYANYATPMGKRWHLQGGLRAEQTTTEGRSVTLNQSTERKYLDLFPSLFLQQNVNDEYQISYNYSRRINRPQYESLNPFVFYLDPYSLVQGNPYLKPQYTHSFSLTQTFKQRYNLLLDYSLTKDFIAEVPVQIYSDQLTIFQQQNVDDRKSTSATLAAPVQVSANWEMNNNTTLLYQRFALNRGEQVLQNEQVTFLAQTNHNILLPGGMRMEINAGYQGPIAYGLYQLKDNWWVDAGLKRSFLNEKLDLSLSVTDVFRTKRIAGHTTINGNTTTSQQYNGTQAFKVNLRYRFSKGEKFEAKKLQVDLNEVDRAGGTKGN
ncbi:outer membrane beta-barrel family protein [Adhaeribacter radiodurans]|uniref:TonB-dependent receptor n=1 Tax=Adhaeribacter radiodurans TaxID=2745197 RepID=A0A7L7L7E0_9BACT|nr:outer membrane beta-barrel family protein [Adhaeribacter radiodurans]QMU28751.1 TonB-dependent receptor [Adhaeribacter radiodurans]